MKKPNPSSIILALSVVVFVALLAVYIFLYQAQPLSQAWNNFWLYAIFAIAATLAAIASTSVVLHFRKTDQPRVVWIYFSLGLWCWAVAELVWMIYGVLTTEIASITLADVFWVSAYAFFALSFVRQYRLIYSTTVKRESLWLGGVLVVVLLVTGAITAFLRFTAQTEQTWFETFLAMFYAVADIAIGLAALRISQVFGRGLWGRVWWGLLFFAFSDALYSWLDFSGLYALSVEAGNLFSLFTDTIYIGAYLLVALACLSQALLMHYGPRQRKIVDDLE